MKQLISILIACIVIITCTFVIFGCEKKDAKSEETTVVDVTTIEETNAVDTTSCDTTGDDVTSDDVTSGEFESTYAEA